MTTADLAPAPAHSRFTVSIPAATAALLALAILLWLISLPAIDPYKMTDLGLVSVLPRTFFLALALLIVGFCLTQVQDNASAGAPAAFVGAWIVIMHGTPAIIYGALRYAWAWKHVGVVEYIQRTGAVDPAIDNLPVYHNWPGFFGTATLFTEAAGLDNALPLANWAPVLFELLFAAAVLLVLRASTADSRLIWLGVWFFALTNWVGQDYFAPQAMAYLFYLTVIGICLWAFPAHVQIANLPIVRSLRRVPVLARLVAAIDRRAAPFCAQGIALPSLAIAQRRGLLAIVLVLLAGIAVSHQLTPLVTILALFALVIVGQCSARGLPFIMTLMTAAWLVTGASGFAAFGITALIASIGRADQNITANLIDASLFSPGLQVISNMARGLSAAVGLLAVLGWIRLFRRGYLSIPLTLLWFVPLGLLGVSGYGGEILFRVYFFALPFMAFFVAALFAPRAGAAWSWPMPLLTAVVSILLATGFLFAYYGHEQSNMFRSGEVAASEFLDTIAPDGALLVEATPNYPSRYQRYEQYVYIPLVAWARGNVEESQNAYSLDDIDIMMSSDTYPAAYLVITRGQLLELSRPGLASIEQIQREIEASPRFEVIFRNDDATIYTIAGRGPGARP